MYTVSGKGAKYFLASDDGLVRVTKSFDRFQLIQDGNYECLRVSDHYGINNDSPKKWMRVKITPLLPPHKE